MFVSMYSHNELLTKFFVFYAKLVKLSQKMTNTNSPI